MATIKKKTKGKQIYYYLTHTIRENNRIIKKEKYLGKQIPKNIEEIKKEFLEETCKEKWYPLFKKIKKDYSKNLISAPKTIKEKNTKAFAIKFTYDTQKIEGSKLTLRETANLLEKNITPKEKPVADIKETESHEKVFYEMLNYKKELSLQIILYWHKKMFEQSKPEIAGKIRKHQVMISGSEFVPAFPAEIYPLLNGFFNWYNKSKKKINPVELAGLVHLKFVTIHPFADGNGRISRLIMNFILHKNKYPLLNIPYKNRTGYYNALERAQTKREYNIFIKWFFRKYIKEYEKYL